MHSRIIEWNESFEDKHLITMNSNWYDLFSLGGIVKQLAEFRARKLRIRSLCTHIHPWTREMCNGSLSLSCTIAQCSTGLPKCHRFLPSRRRNCTFARILWSTHKRCIRCSATRNRTRSIFLVSLLFLGKSSLRNKKLATKIKSRTRNEHGYV